MPEFRDYAAQIVRNAAGPGRGAGRRGLPARVGRHRQPPHAGRPAHLRRRAHRQGGPGGARPGRHHPQQEHHPRRPPLAVRHQRRCASAPRRSPPRAWASRRWPQIAALIARALRGRDDDGRAGGGPRRRRHPLLQVHAVPEPERRRGRRRRAGDSAPTSSSWCASSRSSRSCSTPAACGGWPFRVGAVVQPDERRVHDRPTPTLGGRRHARRLARRHGAWRGGSTRFDAGLRAAAPSRSAWCSRAIVIVVVGVIDDLREVSAPAKIAGIVLAGSVLVISGVSILVFRVPVPRRVRARRADLVVPAHRCCGSSGMANAINLIDGLDGLAGGHRRHRRGRVLPLRDASSATRACSPPGNIGAAHRRDHPRRLPRLPAPQLPPGADLHGRRRRAAARAADGRVDDGRRRPHRRSRSAGRRSSSSPRCSSRS